jgi:hypothetical protein
VSAVTKIKITHKFSGKPEDIERLMYVQRRLIEIGQRHEIRRRQRRRKAARKEQESKPEKPSKKPRKRTKTERQLKTLS